MRGMRFLFAPALVLAISAPATATADTIEIAIGHQSMCTDTYTGGIVVKELGLLEKHLPKTGRYQDTLYEVSWSDYSSGGPITNQTLAGKLNIGVMGNYPLIVNGASNRCCGHLCLGSCQLVLALSMALRVTSMVRMRAVSASLGGLPLARSWS